MERLILSERQLKKLKEVQLDKSIYNTEAILYHIEVDNKKLLLKKLFLNDRENIAYKLYNISMLNKYKDYMNIDELVIPEHLVVVNNCISNEIADVKNDIDLESLIHNENVSIDIKINMLKQVADNVIGFSIPYIDNCTNLGLILKNEKVDIKRKIELLKKVGKILNRIEKLNKMGFSFHINDLHPYNFLVDDNTGELKVVDLDSSTFVEDRAISSNYMCINNNLKFVNKYRFNTKNISYPDTNSDLLCYNMMVLDTISNSNISRMDLNTFYSYIEYLRTLGFGAEFLNSFILLYTNANNISSYKYLDQIPYDKVSRADLRVFKTLKKIK